MRAYVSLPDWDERAPYYGPSLFTDYREIDVYRRPQGATLRRRKANYTTRHIVLYRADAAVCNACLVQASCTTSDHGRQIARSFDAAYLERMRGYHATEDYEGDFTHRRGEARSAHALSEQ